MTSTVEALTAYLLSRLCLVQANLGLPVDGVVSCNARFADLLDSMGLAEFVMLLARDYETTPAAIEELAGRRFDTVAGLATALHAGGLAAPWHREAAGRSVFPAKREPSGPVGANNFTALRSSWTEQALSTRASAWLAATAVRLPQTVQVASAIDQALQRPTGWLESHAGIGQRRVWGDDDPLAAAAQAGCECLDRAGIPVGDVGTLLAVSEAPPMLVGLAALLHHRLGLRSDTTAVEVGGACTGYLAAWWLARSLVAQAGPVLIITVEAPSRILRTEPGDASEAAALFGDAAAACLVVDRPTSEVGTVFVDVLLNSDGGAGHLIRVVRKETGAIQLYLEGAALASRAVRAMAESVRGLALRHGLDVTDLTAVVAHGGNGRLPALLARELGLPAERVWSETRRTGNLGSASLPVAWEAQNRTPSGFVAWTAVGAGLTWGAALTRTGDI